MISRISKCARADWYFLVDDSGWVDYGQTESAQIESAGSFGRTVELKFGAHTYIIAPCKAMQMNKRTKFARKIRRIVGGVPSPLLPMAATPKKKKKKKIKKKKMKAKVSLGDAKKPFPSQNVSPPALPCEIQYKCPSKQETLNVAQITGWSKLTPDKAEALGDCDICKSALTQSPCVCLEHCVGHGFHQHCIERAFLYSQRCPTCCYDYLLRGPQPSGTMQVSRQSGRRCSGYTCGTIQLYYNFPSGTQSYMHPNPTRRFSGTSRMAYLPDNVQGWRVCRLLISAFRKGLLFAVGTSVTTGRNDTTVWNGIHHKTSLSGGPTRYGYPDEGYFGRVINELASKGLYPDDFIQEQLEEQRQWALRRQKSAELKATSAAIASTSTDSDGNPRDLKRFKVSQLRSELKIHGLPIYGKKSVLVGRLAAHLDKTKQDPSCLVPAPTPKPVKVKSTTKVDFSRINQQIAAAAAAGNRAQIKALLVRRAAMAANSLSA